MDSLKELIETAQNAKELADSACKDAAHYIKATESAVNDVLTHINAKKFANIKTGKRVECDFVHVEFAKSGASLQRKSGKWMSLETFTRTCKEVRK